MGCARGGLPAEQVDARAGGNPADGPAADAPARLPADGPSGNGLTGPALLLTEVVLAPSTSEFVEIFNPGAAAVDLSSYFLSDNGTYFRLPAGAQTLDTADFIARFPAGASIPSHGLITVALDTAASFTSAYGVAPTYALSGGAMITVAANGIPSLTNTGELIVLFQWDGTSDLVKDADMVLVGAPTASNGLVDKTAIALDGPDPGSATSTYAADARTLVGQGSTPAAGKSTKRIALEAGHEVQGGTGNGVAGDDETSEATSATWDASGFTVPTPGSIPTALQP